MSSDSDKDDYTVHSKCSSASSNKEVSDSETKTKDDSTDMQKSPARKLSAYDRSREQCIERNQECVRSLGLLDGPLLTQLGGVSTSTTTTPVAKRTTSTRIRDS